MTKAKYAATAFDGEGVRIEGGRWNSPGFAVVYLAENAALAALEIVVHVGSGILPAYVQIPCTFDEELFTRLDRGQLPPNWKSFPAPPELPQLGDGWLRSGSSAILEVPSAIIEVESNYLLSPMHPDFARIEVGAASSFAFG